MNGTAAATVNGHANANGHSSAESAGAGAGHGRTLLIQHSGSGSKLSIPEIPIEVFGLADQLRDEFQDYLAGSETSADAGGQVRSSRLIAVPEDAEAEDEEATSSNAPTVNNAPLFLASYWMEFLALQYASNTARPILVATRDYFSTTFLSSGSLDIHSIGATLSDVQEKKLVISAWVKLCAKIGDGEFGARGQIWREENTRGGDGRVRNYAVFGGQGSNEYYWDEMEYLHDVYGPLFTPLLSAATSLFESLATQHSSTLLYPYHLLPLHWLTTRSSRPPTPYLASCAVSLPLIGLVQLCQYMVTARMQGLSPDGMAKAVKGATGHSQGVVTAAVVAMGGKDWEEYINNACQGLKVLFSIGLRGTEAFPPLSISPAITAASVESGEGIPYPMLAVTGLLQPALEVRIKETNTHLEAHGKGKVAISLFNGLRAFVVTGPPASLVGLVNNLKKGKAESGKDQSKTPHSKRLPVFSMRFLPVGVPYHSPYLHECTAAAMSSDVDSFLASFWTRSKLLIPVYNTETGRDLRTSSSSHSDSELLKELYDQIFTSPIHWAAATKFNRDATHVIDFGTGGQSGIGSLTARESEGRGIRVLVASTGTNGRGIEEVYSSKTLKIESRWMDKFGPKLVKTAHDGKIHLDTAMSRLLSKPPLMVAGMTPCTVGAGFNAAVANAGYHIELAGGGHYNAKALRGKVDDIISRFETPGIGLTLNALYINQRQFTFQLPLWVQMKGEGLPVEGLCVAAGIPSTENATNILDQLRGAGVKHVSFKPGSVEGIRQVVNIASANPDFPIILQWTGGRAGGHHSCEDFHQPILSTYVSIRQYPNIILVGGSGFGAPGEDVWPYLNGSWSEAYGVERMPFDGFLYASRVMVAKEAHTSLSVKQLIVDAPGVGDEKWEGTYDKETGGIITVRSELGEPIHKVATRGVKLWKEFDNTVFALPREKRGAWLAERKDYVISKLNKDFQKPWFAAKADGKVCDLGDMTYAEVASRMVRLMYVAHEKRWIDQSLKNLTGDWLRRTEDRLSSVNDYTPKPSALQSYSSLDDPQPFLTSFFEQYPAAKTQIIASEDIAYFLAICQRPGQKPTPFIAVLDNNIEVWFKKDSLWFAEDVEAVFDQDPQRVCILQGPVAVKHCTKVDEPIAEMFGIIKDNLIKNVLEEFYGGDESKVPTVEYLAQTPAPPAGQLEKNYNIKHTTRQGETSGTTTHVYEISGTLPSTGEWLEHLSGPKLDWLRAFLLSVNVGQGKTGLVENSAKKLFKPRKGQRVEMTVNDADQRPVKVAVFGAIRN